MRKMIAAMEQAKGKVSKAPRLFARRHRKIFSPLREKYFKKELLTSWGLN
jgi:hypothetical protein